MNQHDKHLIGIDIVRFLAAVMVMHFHLAYWSWIAPGGEIYRITEGKFHFADFVDVSWFGWVGVEIFFVLSGYVIAYSANGKEAFRFLRGRTLRLLPTIWICATLSAALLYTADTPVSEVFYRYGRTLTLMYKPPWVDGVYWTLIIELVFYASIFLLLCTNWFVHLEKMAVALLSISVSFLVLFTLYTDHPFFSSQWTHKLLLLRHGVFFVFGILIWLMLHNKITRFRMGAALLCVIGGLLEIYLVTKVRGQNPAIDSDSAPYFIWLTCVLLIIASIAWNRHIHLYLAKYSSVFRTVGLITFPLYLTHSIVGGLTMLAVYQYIGNQTLALFSAYIASIMVAWAVVIAEPIFSKPAMVLLSLVENKISENKRFIFLFSPSTKLND